MVTKAQLEKEDKKWSLKEAESLIDEEGLRRLLNRHYGKEFRDKRFGLIFDTTSKIFEEREKMIYNYIKKHKNKKNSLGLDR